MKVTFAIKGPLAGMAYQSAIEKRAYESTDGEYVGPAQRVT